jgi:hypothetical protein
MANPRLETHLRRAGRRNAVTAFRWAAILHRIPWNKLARLVPGRKAAREAPANLADEFANYFKTL